MYKVLVVSHGELCKGFKSAVEMILGSEEDFDIVSLDNKGVEVFHENLENKIAELKSENDELLILCDLFGGTPFNKSMIEAVSNEAIKIIAGVNLAMVIEAITNKNRNVEEVVKELVDNSRNSILEGVICRDKNVSDE
ncbi:PTS system, mannose-specific IIA component [Clostridium cavendishii DSM 21758]|uniref:PTS system, mannose-specific IIA component n=1 Tax=Clostridium cavendishii DSM 21758 TaxID=1121302 RepID=A0A1M6URW3_9CLOT|nr:PTS sugar transporter subunit IIA [Clostridium cavendishii]SHK71846.1 PTS system, mannose-specific IIA component [Clostridium cavendishii DSM 21758]